jgi:small-conductance mechanosensitive channel
MNEWFTRFSQTATFGGVGILVVAAMVLALQLLLPRYERRLVRSPVLLLFLHLGLVALQLVLPAASGAHRPLQLAAFFVLLVAAGRTAFLLVLHTVVLRRIVAPLPRILEDVFQALIYAVVIFATLRAAGVEPGSLLTTSALLTAVIGLSLQDTLGNLFAGLAIQAQRPFEVGDWIQFDERNHLIGRVEEINWRATRVRTVEQFEVTVPNGTLAKAAIVNYTKPTRIVRRSVRVFVDTAGSTAAVHEILVKAVLDAPGVLAEPEPSVVTRDFSERGIDYEVRYFIDDFERAEPISGNVRDRIYYALRRARLEVPPPRRRVEIQEMSAELERDRQRRLGRRMEAIAAVDFLRVLPEGARRRLAEGSRLRLYAPGETIIQEGQGGEELFIVERGEVRVTVGALHGAEAEVARLSVHDFFGEMSLMTGEQRRATVRAVGEVELLVIGKPDFAGVLEQNPALAKAVSDVLAKRQQELERRRDQDAVEERISVAEKSGILLNRIKQFFSI